MTDLRFCLRSLRSTPGFTATAMLTLVLGMGATTAMFSIVYAVLFRPLPYRDAGRLVNIMGEQQGGVSRRLYEALQGSSGALEQVALYYRNTGWSRVIAGGRVDPEQVQAGFVSAEMFSVLGVAPVVGRGFDAAEVRRGEAVAVLSQGMWMRRFGGSAQVVGQSLELDGRPFTIIGVMPGTFAFPGRDTEVWAPISTHRAWMERPSMDDVHTHGFYLRWNLVGRLRAGATVAMAQQELAVVDARLMEQDRNWNMGLGVKVLPVSIEVGERVRLSLWLLFAAVGLVLLIACANVANLLLARGVARKKEIAVRLALGATEGRIVRQILTESVVLVSLAGCVAVLVAGWMIRLLVEWGPADVPRLDEARVDWVVLLFAVAAAMVTALLFGAGPAWHAARNDPQEGLRRGGGRNTSSGETRTSGVLIVAEFALAIVLALPAGLLLRSLWMAHAVDLGYQPDRLVALRVQYPRSGLQDRLEERLRAIAGVESVGGIRSLFELEAPPRNSLRAVEGEGAEMEANRPLTWTTVSGEYFRAMGIAVVAGRVFSDTDGKGAALAAVIDESMARRYWPGRNPIGRRFKGQDRRGANDDWITVIGVVRDVRRQGVEREPTPHVFLWHRQEEATADWVIRGSVAPEALLRAVREAVRETEPGMVIRTLAPMETLLAGQLAERRFQTWLLTAFAALALGLAAVGIFGVMSHAVVRRTQEIGIRMALGADRRRVVGMILRRGLGLAVAGLVIGFMLSLAVTRMLGSLLFGVSATDPVTLVGAALVLVLVAGVATFVPGWRAAGLDPMMALRRE
ncbi:MAG: ABC transporter permease [Acidobacteria bacterium]|nr:ABC transporter permease [Acidobacteriota bacterium]